MEEKDDIKRVLKLLSEKLKLPENKELMEGFVKELLPFCSTGESRLDEIYELCIEKIIKEQATAFYKDFPIDEIRTRLIEDFIRMDRARRRDDFEEFSLNVFKQIENIVEYYFSNKDFLSDVSAHIEDIAYENKNESKKHADLIIIDSGHRCKLDLKDFFWNEKYNCVLYWKCCHKKWSDEYKEMKRRGSQLQQCRNLVHPGSTKTDYQENILKEVLPNKYQYYLRFTSLLSVFIEKIVESTSIGVIKTKWPSYAIANLNGRDIELADSLLSKFEKGDNILVKSFTTKKGKTIIKEAEKV